MRRVLGGAAVVLLVGGAFIGSGACSDKNADRCSMQLCANDPAPEQADISACSTALADAMCGAKYQAVLDCAQNHPFCDRTGHGNSESVAAGCSTPIAAYTACSGQAPPGPMDGGTPTPTDGGTATPTPGTDSGGIVPTSTCAGGVFDPNKVYLYGTTVEGSGENQCWVSALSMPYEPCLALYADGDPYIRPDGRIFYINTDMKRVLYKFTPDQVHWDTDSKRWDLPSLAESLSNDVAQPTPGCTNPAAVVLWPDSVNYAVRCGSNSISDPLFNSDNTLVGHAGGDGGATAGTFVVALGYTGHVLRSTFGAPFGNFSLYIEDATGAQTRFAQAELLPLNVQGFYRAQKDGFFFVAKDSSASPLALWHLGFDGSAGKIGVYADIPSTIQDRGAIKLDGNGVMFQFGSQGTNYEDDVVLRRPLLPDVVTVAYDEQSGGPLANDFTQPSLVIHPKIHGSMLLTGP